MNESQLIALKKKIENGKEELANLKGQKQYLMNTLKEEFDCTSLESAETLLRRKKEELKELETQINEELEELEESYGELS